MGIQGVPPSGSGLRPFGTEPHASQPEALVPNAIIAELVECIEAAVGNGDWQVDGRCDPDGALHRAKSYLAKPSARFLHYWPAPWSSTRPEGEEMVQILDARGRTIARLEWPFHSMQETDDAELATYVLADAIAAQGIEAQRAETVKQGSVHESPVAESDAPKGDGQ